MTTLIPKIDFKNGGATPTGAINRPIDEKVQQFVSVKDFGAVLDGTTDDTTAIQNAFTALNGTGKLLTFDGVACKITTSISVNNYANFNVDFQQCQITYTGSAGTYLFDMTQAGNIKMTGGFFTGTSNANNFVKTYGSAAAQATTYPTIPSDNQWSRRLYFADFTCTGFSTVFDLRNFSREIWIDNANITGNLKAINIVGKVVNTNINAAILYSAVASSNSVVCRGDSGDVAWRYAEGLFLNDCIADVQGYAFDIQDIYLMKVNGGQIQSPGAAVAITKGITPLTRNFWFTDIQFNGPVIVGSGLASQYLFDGTFTGVFQGIADTAISINENSKNVTINGQFDSPSGTPTACAVGANCVGISFSGTIDAAYTTSLTVDSTSVSGVSAQFSALWTPALQFGSASTGITYSVQEGSYQWTNGYILGSFRISLTNKGSATGVATIAGLPFAATAEGTATIGTYSSFNTSINPIISIAAAGTTMTVKTSGGGSQVALSNTDFSNTSIINGTFIYRVKS